ncbi:MAG: 1-deoxy-D-xylulose-5-phosphate reductoisomerase [Bacteroidales bacterium]|nr:1-deoxy-D-xylulose-5-phosphate reductoisomerase [Bacteroidales bacterium]
MRKEVAILGSTGSIGTQTLDVISRSPDRFSVKVLTAWSNVDLLAEQAKKFNPQVVIVGNKDKYPLLKEKLNGYNIELLAGTDEISKACEQIDADIFLGAIVGYAGLNPVVNALKRGKNVALANKETLVVAGAIIKDICRQSGASVIPVDSEHSAIFQCLVGEQHASVEKITLTASGGPFLNYSLEQLKNVGPENALAHPNWNMGAKVTIDSSSLMNKGLEVIEAKWLFDLTPEQIDVVIHPQSVIHSFVHYHDGSVKAQVGVPDMRVPILYALGYPERIKSDLPRIDFAEVGKMTFLKPDRERFRNLDLAYSALKQGGNMPCVLNAANEIAVKAFLDKKVGFLQMTEVIARTLENIQYLATPNLYDLEMTDKEARAVAQEIIDKGRLSFQN